MASDVRVTSHQSQVTKALRAFWAWLREVSGDDAYDRYVAHHREKHAAEGPPLSRKEFYRRRTEQKYDPAKPSRCC